MAKKTPKIYNDFVGGWNADSAPDKLQDNEFELADNVDLEIRGAFSQRKGCTPVYSSGYSGEVSRIIEWAMKDGTHKYFAMIGNTLCLLNPTTWAVDAEIITLDDTDMGYFFFKEHFYFTGKQSSVDKYWKYGVGTQQVETNTVVGTVTTAGNATVIVTAAGMSNSPITLNVAVSLNDTAATVANKIMIALMANTDITAFFDVTKVDTVITLKAKTRAANDTTMNISIANGTCAGLTNSLTSTNTTAGVADLVTVTPHASGGDLSKIKKCRIFTWNHKNFRVYASGNPDDPSALYYSEGNDPTYFKDTSILYPNTVEGPVINLSLFSTGLIVHYQNSLSAWQGVDVASDATWERIPAIHGTIARDSVQLTPGTLTMLGIGGLFSLSSIAMSNEYMVLVNDDLSVNKAEGRVTSVINSIVHPETATAIYDPVRRKYLLAYGDDALNSKNNKILVYDWPLNAFVRYTGISVNHFCMTSQGDILVASGNYILKMFSGYNDWDITTGQAVPVVMEARSKGWDLGTPLHMKNVKKMFVGGMQYPDTDTTLDLGLISGYKSLLFEDVLIDESFTWGEEWGRLWGWTDVITKELNSKIKGSRFQFYCRHDKIDEGATIFAVGLLYTTTRPKGVKVKTAAKKDSIGAMV